jgi:hypothetical protein
MVVNGEDVSVWKETAVAYFRLLSRNSPGQTV